jgi:hypothetical protein
VQTQHCRRGEHDGTDDDERDHGQPTPWRLPTRQRIVQHVNELTSRRPNSPVPRSPVRWIRASIGLSNDYIAAVDIASQRQIAGQIETLLLNEAPIIYSYFYYYLSASAKNVTGVYPTAIGHLFLDNATKM